MCQPKQKNRIWHYLLAVVVAGLPLAVAAPCLCGESSDGAQCCAVETVCQQLTKPCCPAKPCCCREEVPQQPVARTAKTDDHVRQQSSLSTDLCLDSLLSPKQDRLARSCEVAPVPSLRLHAVLGVWLN